MTADTYLNWLIKNTKTTWWHDSADPVELQRGLDRGAIGVTTNPFLSNVALAKNRAAWAADDRFRPGRTTRQRAEGRGVDATRRHARRSDVSAALRCQLGQAGLRLRSGQSLARGRAGSHDGDGPAFPRLGAEHRRETPRRVGRPRRARGLHCRGHHSHRDRQLHRPAGHRHRGTMPRRAAAGTAAKASNPESASPSS